MWVPYILKSNIRALYFFLSFFPMFRFWETLINIQHGIILLEITFDYDVEKSFHNPMFQTYFLWPPAHEWGWWQSDLSRCRAREGRLFYGRKASMKHFFLSPVPLRTAHTEKLHPLRHPLHYRETIPEKSKRYNRGNGRQK